MFALAVAAALVTPVSGPLDTVPDLAPESVIYAIDYEAVFQEPDPLWRPTVPPPAPVVVPGAIDYQAPVVPVVVTPPPPPPPPPAPPVAPSAPVAPGVDWIAVARTAPNGEVPAQALCGLSWDPGAVLRCDGAMALERAADAGMPRVAMTSTYRTYADQVAVKAARGAWAARPGTSNHGWGVAIDIPEPARSWLHQHPEYGWINPAWAKPGGAGMTEEWHFEYTG